MSKSGTGKYQFAASVLLDAVYTNDEAACAKYGITPRTLRNYRRKLHEDADFAAIFHTKEQELSKAWAGEFIAPLRKGAQFLLEAFEACRSDPMFRKNPVVIQSVAEAVRLCADVVLTSKAIDAQFSNPDQPANQLPEEVSPAEAFLN